jgi:hypothetical protein
MPPEYVLTSRPARFGEPEVGEQVVHARSHGMAPQPVQPALQHQVLPAGGGRVGAGTLGHDADHLPQVARLGQHVDALDAGGPRVGPGEGGEDLDGGGLACSVRAEQAVDHAARNADVQPVQRPDAVLAAAGGVGLD